MCSTSPISGLEELYGAATWTLGYDEWTKIHESTRIYTSRLLPGPFFVALAAILSDDVAARAAAPAPVQYWKEHSHMFLGEIKSVDLKTVPVECRRSVDKMQQLLLEVEGRYKAFGFGSREVFETMLCTPICSLATSVCVAQKGYCLLDEDRQLQTRIDTELVCRTAPRIAGCICVQGRTPPPPPNVPPQGGGTGRDEPPSPPPPALPPPLPPPHSNTVPRRPLPPRTGRTRRA